ncbi:hypothetical protein PF010_g21398 [Phytophthora fragariae]|uniref:Uncharacterized protein n=1 Tax=Phytophthora fragariae TaxID=53985 RepID=A0A6A3R7X1_9STRA|nr:hypothetical protein PF009_g17009 [Phytophthora fragariae]KAE9082917.1 hypothetical protein PF010_g21398 [Phytophthora fragariae]KAE9091661.1 hypothetical protein PF007_g18789 [Phytophthora fragariae]KAE9122688.1 hypothetical protein PF006_g17594 [Phytophthora fragariae]KAE9294215.1 hypothetical protein PF001_g17886 [Phytophthora fragariae]
MESDDEGHDARRDVRRLRCSFARIGVTQPSEGEGALLAQFYRNLDKTTRQLVKQSPTPRAVEEAVDKASDTDDQMDNVVKGMENISQSWATAPNPFPVPMAVTTGQTMVIPGVGNPDLAGYVAGEGGLMAGSDSAWVLCTNPRGVFNRWSGTLEPPTGRGMASTGRCRRRAASV